MKLDDAPITVRRYYRYRSYGHPRWVALALAPPPEWWLYSFAAQCVVVVFLALYRS